MIHGHYIARAQLRNDACNDRLLCCSQVHLARNQAILPQLSDRFLKLAAFSHECIE
jgi:hypothetical protein